nr:hypothetical protein [Halomicroarcula sp. XH51]
MSPGRRASAALMSPETSVPWTMRRPKRVPSANSASVEAVGVAADLGELLDVLLGEGLAEADVVADVDAVLDAVLSKVQSSSS